MTKLLNPGSVSCGTLNELDLLRRFTAALETVADTDDEDSPDLLAISHAHALIEFHSDLGEDDVFDPDELPGLLDELVSRLDDHCPPGYSFGTLEGDGADFGVWAG